MLASVPPASAQAQRRPPPLLKIAAFPEAYREAARAVAASVSHEGEKPSEFFAEIEPEKGGRILVFHLWHKSAFTRENIGSPGNPGGKCRDVLYDTKKHRVTQTWGWQ